LIDTLQNSLKKTIFFFFDIVLLKTIHKFEFFLKKIYVLKYTFYLIFTIFILSSLSCNRVQSKLNNASNQIENAQQNIKEMNSSDWSELKNTMTELEDHFESNKDNYSDEQVKEIGRIQGKYAALLVKKGINDFQESLKDLGNQVDGFVEGITDTTNTKNK
jgi:hypothetical protein